MEQTVHLRKANLRDIPAILEIEQECFREDSFSREQFAYLIGRSKGTFYVVVEQEQIIAYISLLLHAGTHYLRIYSIEQTIATAHDCKAAKITLEVKVTNTPAIRLYMKNGFIPVGVKPAYYHDGSDAIYMQRTL